MWFRFTTFLPSVVQPTAHLSWISVVAIGKPEQDVCQASYCGGKQQQRSHAMITLLLLLHGTYIWVLFFAHIPFVVHSTFNTTPVERLQQCHATGDG